MAYLLLLVLLLLLFFRLLALCLGLLLLRASGYVLSDFHGLVLEVIIGGLDALEVVGGQHLFQLLHGCAHLLLHAFG